MNRIPYAGFDPTERHSGRRIPHRAFTADEQLLAAVKRNQESGLLLREIAAVVGVPLAKIHEVVLADLRGST